MCNSLALSLERRYECCELCILRRSSFQVLFQVCSSLAMAPSLVMETGQGMERKRKYFSIVRFITSLTFMYFRLCMNILLFWFLNLSFFDLCTPFDVSFPWTLGRDHLQGALCALLSHRIHDLTPVMLEGRLGFKRLPQILLIM